MSGNFQYFQRFVRNRLYEFIIIFNTIEEHKFHFACSVHFYSNLSLLRHHGEWEKSSLPRNLRVAFVINFSSQHNVCMFVSVCARYSNYLDLNN